MPSHFLHTEKKKKIVMFIVDYHRMRSASEIVAPPVLLDTHCRPPVPQATREPLRSPLKLQLKSGSRRKHRSMKIRTRRVTPKRLAAGYLMRGEK